MQFIRSWIQDAYTFHMTEEISVERYYNASKNISPQTFYPLVMDTTSIDNNRAPSSAL